MEIVDRLLTRVKQQGLWKAPVSTSDLARGRVCKIHQAMTATLILGYDTYKEQAKAALLKAFAFPSHKANGGQPGLQRII